jgi:FkbM family methyltransferase
MLLNAIAENLSFCQSVLLNEFKQSPFGFIDVGARGGVHDIVEPFAKYTSVLAFEPDSDECRRLLAIKEVSEPWAEFILEPMALADSKGEAELVLLSASTNHSLRAPNLLMTERYQMEKWREIGRESLIVETLDNVIADSYEKQKYVGEFIKLDTQGSEFEIITGAQKTLLDRTVAVVCEVSFAELYKGQKLFSEVELKMRELGFSFYGFTSMFTRSKKQLNKLKHRTQERAFYTDAIFFKDPLSGLKCSEHQNLRQTYALFISAVLLGYYDFSLELAKETWLKKANENEVNAIENFIKTVSMIKSEDELNAVKKLSEFASSEPELVNLHIGAFVDQRRANNDFHDVLNTLATPQPK